MSKPPDNLCICALLSQAYPQLSDHEVIAMCNGQWHEIKELVRRQVTDAIRRLNRVSGLLARSSVDDEGNVWLGDECVHYADPADST